MTPRDVHVDHDEIAQKARQMSDVMSELMALRNGLEGIVTSMVAEASVATSSGEPAPIFGPLINSATEAVKRLQKSLDAVEHRVSADFDILTRMSDEVKALSEDSARSIDGADTDYSRGSGGAGTSPTFVPVSGSSTDDAKSGS